MLIDLSGQTVFVTGGGTRLGKVFSEHFAHKGCNIVIHHRNKPEDAEQTASAIEALGVKAMVVQADFADHAQSEAAIKAAEDHFGHVDILINNASNYYRTHILDITPDELDLVLQVNLAAPFYLSKLVIATQVEKGIHGSIINIADQSGVQNLLNREHHGVSKSGLVAMTKIVARNIARYQIRMNCIVPGPFLKPVDVDEAYWAEVPKRVPLKRVAEPSDIARAGVFLAENDFITGTVLHVDGGEALANARLDPS